MSTSATARRFRVGTPFDRVRRSVTPSGPLRPARRDRGRLAVAGAHLPRGRGRAAAPSRAGSRCTRSAPRRRSTSSRGRGSARRATSARRAAASRTGDELDAPVRATYRVVEALAGARPDHLRGELDGRRRRIRSRRRPSRPRPTLLDADARRRADPLDEAALRRAAARRARRRRRRRPTRRSSTSRAARVELGSGLTGTLRATWHRPVAGGLGALAGDADGDPAARVVVDVDPAASRDRQHRRRRSTPPSRRPSSLSAGLEPGRLDRRAPRRRDPARDLRPPEGAAGAGSFAPTLPRWRIVAPQPADARSSTATLNLDLAGACLALEGFYLDGRSQPREGRSTASTSGTLTMDTAAAKEVRIEAGAWGTAFSGASARSSAPIRADLGARPLVVEDSIVDGSGVRPARVRRRLRRVRQGRGSPPQSTLRPGAPGERRRRSPAPSASSRPTPPTACSWTASRSCRQQEGCLRHCYLGPDLTTPPAAPLTYRCGPFPAPTFGSVGFEAAGYYALELEPDHPLLSAAGDGGEVGAYHHARARGPGRRAPAAHPRVRPARPSSGLDHGFLGGMMTGDYTKVPLRLDDRWTGARMQQGRVLLDHEWNLNLDASARAAQAAAADVIGFAGVVAGTPDFGVAVTPSGTLDLNVQRRTDLGRGDARLRARRRSPTPRRIRSRRCRRAAGRSSTSMSSRSTSSRRRTPSSSTRRSPRSTPPPGPASAIGCGSWPTTQTTCKDAWDGFVRVPGSTGLLSIARTAPAVPPDPCAPPGDPLGAASRRALPRRGARRRQRGDGALRLVVRERGGCGRGRLDRGQPGHARAVGGGQVRERRPGRGLLARPPRRPRRPRRALHRLAAARDGRRRRHPHARAAGDRAGRRSRPRRQALGRRGRRRGGRPGGDADGRPTSASRSPPAPGAYSVGDWWGARVREEEGVGIELRTSVRPGRDPARLRAARARRSRRPLGAPRLPADVRAAHRAEAGRGRLHDLGASRRRPPERARQPPRDGRRALSRSRRLRGRRAGADQGALAHRRHRRRPCLDHPGERPRGGAARRHLGRDRDPEHPGRGRHAVSRRRPGAERRDHGHAGRAASGSPTAPSPARAPRRCGTRPASRRAPAPAATSRTCGSSGTRSRSDRGRPGSWWSTPTAPACPATGCRCPPGSASRR